MRARDSYGGQYKAKNNKRGRTTTDSNILNKTKWEEAIRRNTKREQGDTMKRKKKKELQNGRNRQESERE